MQKKYISLEEIRTFLSENKSDSQTTLAYQIDVFENVINCLNAGDCVIEVGAFKGGLSCQLAFLLEYTGKDVIIIDVVAEYIQWIKHLIQRLGITTKIVYFIGTLQQFVDEYPQIRPSVIIIDADHKYEGVSLDIQAIKSIKFQPVAVIFHDLSLRYCRGQNALQVRVDQAIGDHYLRYGYKYKEIGASANQFQGSLQRILQISGGSANYHYHDQHHSEGILIVINEKKFMRFSPWIWRELHVWSQHESCSYFLNIKILCLHIWDYLKNQNRFIRKLRRIKAMYKK
jgi:hypothetical protein